MKTNIKHIFCAAAIAATCAGAAQAQSRSAYFLDNYAYNYQMNPAMYDVNNSYNVSFPFLGGLNVGMMGNTGVKSFLYNTADGRTTTFLNPEISASEVMSNIKTNNRIGLEVRETLFNIGFRGMGGYNHVSINAVANAQVRIPGNLVSFLKEGITNQAYEIGRINAHADAFAELALNHSHEIKGVKGLRLGGTLKFLIGLGNADVNLNRANVNLGEDSWTAVTEGTAKVNVKGFRYEYHTNDQGVQYVDGVNLDDFSAPSGYGLAFDFGATYELNADWKFALGFTDIGFISWNTNAVVTTSGERTFDSNDTTFNPDDIESSWDKMKDDIAELYQLQGNDDEGSRTRALGATMNASVEYTLPTYRQLSFGLLNTTHMAHHFAWTEFRVSANYQPVKWFGMGVNYGIGTFGSSFGWILNVAPKSFNFYIGMDRTLGSLAKQGVPLNSNGQLSVGINFPI